jgi:hypothetical protein
MCIWGANSGEFVTDITVEDNEVTNIPYVAAANAHGYIIQGRSSSIYLDRAGLCAAGVRFNRNKALRVAGYGAYLESIIAGGSFANQANNNTIVGVGDGNLDVHCLAFQGVQDMECFDNVVGDSRAFSGGTTGTGVGIFIDMPTADSRDGCDRIKVRRNRIFNTGQGAGLGIEVGGAGIFVLSSRQIDVQYNVIEDCTNGIVTQGGFPADHASQNVLVENNTILRSSRNGIMTIGRADLVTVRNNHVNTAPVGIFLQTSVEPSTNYAETNNAVSGCTQPFTQGGDPGTTETARTPSGTNTSTDARASTDGRPLPGSPLLTAGADLGYRRDIENKQGRKFIGAYAAARLRSPI